VGVGRLWIFNIALRKGFGCGLVLCMRNIDWGWSSWITMPRITTQLLGGDDEIVRRGLVQFFCMDLFTLCIPVLIHMPPFKSSRERFHPKVVPLLESIQFSFLYIERSDLICRRMPLGTDWRAPPVFIKLSESRYFFFFFLMESWCTLTSCQLGLFLSVNSTRAECNLASSCFNFVKALSLSL